MDNGEFPLGTLCPSQNRGLGGEGRACPRQHSDSTKGSRSSFLGEMRTLGTRGFGSCLISSQLAGRGSKQHSQTLGKHIQEQEDLELVTVSLLELQMTEQRKRRQRMGFVDVQNTMNH